MNENWEMKIFPSLGHFFPFLIFIFMNENFSHSPTALARNFSGFDNANSLILLNSFSLLMPMLRFSLSLPPQSLELVGENMNGLKIDRCIVQNMFSFYFLRRKAFDVMTWYRFVWKGRSMNESQVMCVVVSCAWRGREFTFAQLIMPFFLRRNMKIFKYRFTANDRNEMWKKYDESLMNRTPSAG